MSLDNLIIDEIKVRKKKLFVSVRNLGSFYVNYKHTFPTKILKNRELDDLIKAIKNSELADCKTRVISNVFKPGILQIDASIEEMDKLYTRLNKEFIAAFNNTFNQEYSELKEEIRKSQNALNTLKKLITKKDKIITKDFVKEIKKLSKEIYYPFNLIVKEHYTEQARWRYGNAGSIASLDARLISILKEKKKIESMLERFEEKIHNKLKIKYKQNYISYHNNELNKIFEEYNGSNFKKIKENFDKSKISKSLDEKILTKRKEIADKIFHLNDEAKKISNDCYLKFETNDKSINLYLDSPKYFKAERMLAADELLKQKWLFIDIEKPLFGTPDEEISWVGLLYRENNKLYGEIHTKNKLKIDKINGFKIFNYNSEEEIIKGTAASIKKENPFIFSIFNAKFDLIELRQTEADFDIGARQTEPIKEVSKEFFERIGVHGRLVFDLYRASTTAFNFLPVQKLAAVAKYVLGEDKFEKDITYKEMASLETICQSNKTERFNAAQKIASYLSNDVRVLMEILFNTKEGRSALEDYAFLSQTYKTELPFLVHSSNAINNAQKKLYFEKVGTYREVVYLPTRQLQELDTKARMYFQKIKSGLIEWKPKQGLFKDIYKAYIPLGLSKEVAKRFPDINKLVEYKSQFSDNKRKFFLQRFLESFARYMVTDYGIYKMEKASLEKKLEEKNIDAVKFYRLCLEFIKDLPKKTDFVKFEIFKNNAIIKSFTGITVRETWNLLNSWLNVRKKNRKMFGNYLVGPMEIEEKLKKNADEIKDFLKKNDFEIIYANNNYLYLTDGNDNALENDKSPLIFVDKIPTVYIADKLYYKKYGFFHGIKVEEDKPTDNLTMFEMRLYKSFLSNVLEGKTEIAEREIHNDLSSLAKAENRELVFYTKSRECYSVYEDGKKTRFYVKDRKDPQIDENGRKYVTEDGEKVYILNFNEINPDLLLYRKRIASKIKKLTAPMKQQLKLF